MQVKWLLWQVLLPIAGPVILAGLIVMGWASGDENFVPNYSIVLDVSPWALTFYALTLIGSTLHVFWRKLSEHPGIGAALIGVAFAVGVYASFIVIWRHDPNFVPGASVYYVTVFLLFASVALCHWGQAKS